MEIVQRFVDFAEGYVHSDGRVLKSDEKQTMLDILTEAGFAPTDLIPGVLTGHYRDEDCRMTGQTFSYNSQCPFRMTGDDSADEIEATKWLNHVFVIAANKERSARTKAERVNVIVAAVERSIPLEPIKLTSDGDFLVEHNYRPGLKDHCTDENGLPSVIGYHKECGGRMKFLPTRPNCYVAVCESCFLRIEYPTTCQTYGDLRAALAQN